MRKTYFASFQLGEPNKAPKLEGVIEACKKWITKPRKDVDPELLKDIDFEVSGDHMVGENSNIFIRRYIENGTDHYALRMEHPDYKEKNIMWVAETCFATKENETKAAITTSVGRVQDVLTPLPTQPSRPRIIKNLVDEFGAYEASYQITSEPVVLGDKDVKTFVEFLKSKERSLPVVAVSVESFTDKPLVDPNKVSDKLVGLAHVYTYTNRFQSFKLSDSVGKWLSCYEGAVRIYWPGFSTTDSPNKHKVVKPWEVKDFGKSLPDRLLAVLSRMAAGRVPPDEVTWEGIERKINFHKLKNLKKDGDTEKVLQAYETEIEGLKKGNRELQEQIEEERKNSENYKHQAESFKEAYLSLRSTGKVEDEGKLLPPTSVEDVVNKIEEEFSDRVEFKLIKKSFVKGNPFEDVEGLYSAFRFLATTYFEARTGVQNCLDLKKACKDSSGFTYTHNQEKTTMGRFSNFYKLNYGGKNVLLEEHLGKSTTRDPRETIRVGFFFDKDEEKIVVGYIGKHQKNRLS